MIFVEGDLSQIESRIVFLLSGDPELVRLAQLPPWENDVHSENAKAIIGAKLSDPDWKIKRHVGKIMSHGAQRDMHGKKLSDTILKELDILISPERCDQYIASYHQRYPAIKNGYFRETRKAVMRDKMLVNSWGRQIDFRYDRMDDDLFRKAYSFLPQSENADLLSQRGLLPTWRYMRDRFQRPPNVQVHDSILCSVPPLAAYDLAAFIQRNLEQPILIGGVRFRPFVEVKLGINWAANEKLGEGREWKKLPSREEFTEAALALERKRLGH